MEARRRHSTSTSLSHDDVRVSMHNNKQGSGSVTPLGDFDDDGNPRRTRGRNPLPPTSGPLFPPLPPKQHKNSPKNSPQAPSRSPTSKILLAPSSTFIVPMIAAGGENVASKHDKPRSMAEMLDTPASQSTLAPSNGEQVVDTVRSESAEDGRREGSIELSKDNGDDDGDDWDAYRRHRGVRGFSAAKAVKLELVDRVEESQGDLKDDNNYNPTGSQPEALTPLDEEDRIVDDPAVPAVRLSPSLSGASVDAVARHSRRRRGEEQLLLDDHLLPKEMRVHGQIAARRERSGTSKTAEGVIEVQMDQKHEEKHDGQDLEAEDTGILTDDQQAVSEQSVDEDQERPDDEDVTDEMIEEGDDDDDGKDVTRCVCKREDIDVMMIQCDKCNVWQHGACMGIWGDDEAPDEYFCEECRPDLHGPLRKWIRSKGRNAANFVAPTPTDLQNLHSSSDRLPPSQSKRWSDPKHTNMTSARPSSRSHHRKDRANSIDDDRRATRGRAPPTASAKVDKSSIVAKDAPRDRRRGTERRVSRDISPSGSPPAGRQEPKKRSTMNSRDAAYEEAVKAALEASRREMSSLSVKEEETGDERKRRRTDDDEGEEEKMSKRKKEDNDVGDSALSSQSKPKHPNQYTYRPKSAVAAAASPARRGAGTPQPSGPPPSHDHGTRRAGAIASNLASASYTAASISNLNWYLPDHLSSFADLLPAPTPIPLELPTPRSLTFLSRNHFLNQHYGPFNEDRDQKGNLILPGDRPLREVEGDAINHREPPTRIRYPVKRITVVEMRKRVRNLLEYMGRIKSEENRRHDRATLIGVPEFSTPRPRLPLLVPEPGSVELDNGPFNEDDDIEMHDEERRVLDEFEHHSSVTPKVPSSIELLEEFTRDLVAFQETFQSAGMGGFGLVSSLPSIRPASELLDAAANQSLSSFPNDRNGFASDTPHLNFTPTEKLFPETDSTPDPTQKSSGYAETLAVPRSHETDSSLGVGGTAQFDSTSTPEPGTLFETNFESSSPLRNNLASVSVTNVDNLAETKSQVTDDAVNAETV